MVSMDFPALPHTWKVVNPTLWKWMTSAQSRPKPLTKKRNLEMIPFLDALSPILISLRLMGYGMNHGSIYTMKGSRIHHYGIKIILS